MLQRFFRNNRMFEPRRAKYQGFVPTGYPEFKHRLFSEFSCHEEANPNYTGLLRLWDFSVEDEFLVEESRRPVAERERTILGHIRIQNPDFYDNYVLRSIAHDTEFTLLYSEIFDRQPDLERLTRFAPSVADLPIARRLEIARLFLDRVAALHRLRVAHRDLDRHSVWIDDARSKVVLSGFGAAHFPARTSIGATRSKLLAGGVRVPEDGGRSKPGTPFQHDVFLAGAVVWNLLTGDRLPLEGSIPKWVSGSIEATDVPPQYGDWFDHCLAADPRDRFTDGVEAADAFGELIQKAEKISLERQLERYRQDVDPMSDYTPTEWKTKKPYRVYRSGEGDTAVFVKSWPERNLGEPRKSAARLIEFFGRAEALKGSPDWAPAIKLACLCADGLLLVQEWIDGASLSETDTSTWSLEQRRDFIGGLIRAVDGLHSFGLAHGDLSPANVMLRKGVSAFRPVLVDVVDFSLEQDGKSTPAYCPELDHDLRMRDRFAVCAIAKEIVAGATDQEASLIALGAERCGEGDTPWLTLRPLAGALIPAKVAVEPLNIAVELRHVVAEGAMLGDNGVFHVVRSKGRDGVIEVVGFDQKLTIEFDPGDAKPKFGRADRVSPATLDWARGYALFSLNANIDLRRFSNISRFTGVDKLIRMVLEVSPRSSLSSPAPAETSAGTADDSAEPKQFPVARFWKETISVEEAARPEIRLASDPRWDDLERTLSFECDKGIEDVMPLEGQSVVLTWNGSVSGAAGVCPRTARKWVERYRREGLAGLRDRSSRPHRLYRPTPQAVVEQIEALRRQRCTGKQIAAQVGLSAATVSRILRRLGLNRIASLEPAEPVRRYEREQPGEMIHLDIKKLGRFDRIGHRITGDRKGQSNSARGERLGVRPCRHRRHSRIAFAKVMPNEKKRSAVAFLKAALAYYDSLGVKVERVMTDNGSCYKSFAFRKACKRLGLKHIRTRPYTPKTNGKAERFIQTSLREWAYAQAYHHSQQRTDRAAVLAAPLQLAQTACRHR